MKSFQFIVFAVVFITGVVSSSLLELEDGDWENWKAHHGRSYSGHEEEVRRKEIWEENMAMIAKHNLNYQSGVHSYRLSMNQFGDLKPDEFLQLYTGLKRNITRKTVPDQPSTEDVTEVPSSVDWRKKGYVTKIKNQGRCGSCWAFSATGALEGQNFKKTGKLVSLSEQNLVDCTMKSGNYGCNGGFMERAFQYIVHAGGIDTEESYPYEAKDGQCRFKTSDIGAICRGYTVRYFSEKSLKKAVAKVGPISVAIDATSSFRFYSHGIFSDPTCKSDILNHAVLVVGYGSSSGQDYWIVKNSWGTSWGMEGYVLMSRNNNNQCGIATDASYPLV